jgi:hypothetical protein
MQLSFKSVVIGAVSGIATYFISIYTLGYTSAIAMPKDFSLALWDSIVVFGLGASLVAFAIHYVALRTLRVQSFPSFAAFLVTVIAALGIAGLLSTGGNAMASWVLGALFASLVASRLRGTSKNPHSAAPRRHTSPAST